MIGPNSRPTLAVPTACNQNSPIMMTTAIGITNGSNPALTVANPSTADSTDTAGVIMQSPKYNAVARTPRMTRLDVQRPPPLLRWISARSARLPPSPLLSARMMMKTYFSVTISISDQKTRLTTPKMFS